MNCPQSRSSLWLGPLSIQLVGLRNGVTVLSFLKMDSGITVTSASVSMQNSVDLPFSFTVTPRGRLSPCFLPVHCPEMCSLPPAALPPHPVLLVWWMMVGATRTLLRSVLSLGQGIMGW